jgi:hypothetical protein
MWCVPKTEWPLPLTNRVGRFASEIRNMKVRMSGHARLTADNRERSAFICLVGADARFTSMMNFGIGSAPRRADFSATTRSALILPFNISGIGLHSTKVEY